MTPQEKSNANIWQLTSQMIYFLHEILDILIPLASSLSVNFLC
ncbi:hypothetical protein ECDEC14A_2178 [Escherichia coli DEC14A]|nr:hypothetical protein ECDEC14A_2178 [Escherichia coli DEC14A]